VAAERLIAPKESERIWQEIAERLASSESIRPWKQSVVGGNEEEYSRSGGFAKTMEVLLYLHKKKQVNVFLDGTKKRNEVKTEQLAGDG
jgi:hypothetical protein